MAMAAVRVKKWSRQEWQRLIELGVVGPRDRLELLDGEIVEMSPPSPSHAGTTRLIAAVLQTAFGLEFMVSVNAPLALDAMSEPEPDIAVFRGAVRDFLVAHPADPVLLVEVALSSLAKDRDRKASLYARSGAPDYWIANLDAMGLEVYRDPIQGGKGFYEGWSYRSVTCLHKGDTISPLALGDLRIAVSDLLP